MSYRDIARAATDGDLQQRLVAAAAQEGHPSPQSFIQQNIWTIVSNEAIAGPYSYAIGNRVDRPGYYEDIVNDQTILSVVQPLVMEAIAPPEEGSA